MYIHTKIQRCVINVRFLDGLTWKTTVKVTKSRRVEGTEPYISLPSPAISLFRRILVSIGPNPDFDTIREGSMRLSTSSNVEPYSHRIKLSCRWVFGYSLYHFKYREWKKVNLRIQKSVSFGVYVKRRLNFWSFTLTISFFVWGSFTLWKFFFVIVSKVCKIIVIIIIFIIGIMYYCSYRVVTTRVSLIID